MTLEPYASRRLHMMLASTSDLTLRKELHLALLNSPMPFVPSVGLRNAIIGCDGCSSDGASPIDRSELCAGHRARMNVELCADRAVLEDGPVDHLDDLMRRAMSRGELGTELLGAFRRQARALDAVWEAYRRGAANLPDGVAASVEDALVKVPRMLSGAPTRITTVA